MLPVFFLVVIERRRKFVNQRSGLDFSSFAGKLVLIKDGDKKVLMPYEEFRRKNGEPDTKNIKINDCLEVLY